MRALLLVVALGCSAKAVDTPSLVDGSLPPAYGCDARGGGLCVEYTGSHEASLAACVAVGVSVGASTAFGPGLRCPSLGALTTCVLSDSRRTYYAPMSHFLAESDCRRRGGVLAP